MASRGDLMSYAEKMKEATFIGLRDVVYVPAYEAECIGAEADAALAAKNAEVAKLREELTEARKVMEELVALSDMKRKVCAEHGWPDHDVRADYKRRISAAWESARAFLARKETP